MTENAILTQRDKEILEGKVGEEEYEDFNNRIYKIRSRVKRRTDALISEIRLLQKYGEEDIADYLLENVSDFSEGKLNGNLEHRLTSLEEELEMLERDRDRIEELKDEISLIRDQLEKNS